MLLPTEYFYDRNDKTFIFVIEFFRCVIYYVEFKSIDEQPFSFFNFLRPLESQLIMFSFGLHCKFYVPTKGYH